MSWRSFLTPFNERNIHKDEVNNSRGSHNRSQNGIQASQINDKSSFDISEALQATDVFRRMQEKESPLPKRNETQSDAQEITYNFSNTNVTQDAIFQQHNTKAKPNNRLTKIQDEMSQLKNELSKFPKRVPQQKIASPLVKTPYALNSPASKQEQKQNNTMNISKYDELSFSQNKQLDHDSFITEDDIQQISESLQDHLSKYDKSSSRKLFADLNQLDSTHQPVQSIKIKKTETPASKNEPQKEFRTEQSARAGRSPESNRSTERHYEDIKNDLGLERKLKQQIQSQLAFSNEEIFRLNAQVLAMQNQFLELKKAVSTGTEDKKLINSADQSQQTNISPQKQSRDLTPSQLMSQSPMKTKSTPRDISTLELKNSLEINKSQNTQIKNLRKSRNQLLEALESILKVIGSDKTKGNGSRLSSKLKEQLKIMQSTKQIFKTKISSLRQQFMEIGHIQPLSLSFKEEIEAMRQNYSSSNSSQADILLAVGMKPPFQTTRNQIERKDLHPLQALALDKLSLAVPPHQFSQTGKESPNENLNYTHTDINSFYDNLNESLSLSKGTVLNTNKINRMMMSSYQHEAGNVSQKEQYDDHCDRPLQTNQQQCNYDSLNSEKAEQKQQQQITLSKPSTEKNTPLREKVTYSQVNSSSPPLQHFITDPSSKQFSTRLHPEEMSVRQNIPIPLDLSQKTKDLKQKIMSNSVSITQQDKNKESLHIQKPLSLVEQYKQQQQQQQNNQLFQNHRRSFDQMDNLMKNNIQSYEQSSYQRQSATLSSNHNEDFLSFQALSQHNSPQNTQLFYK